MIDCLEEIPGGDARVFARGVGFRSGFGLTEGETPHGAGTAALAVMPGGIESRGGVGIAQDGEIVGTAPCPEVLNVAELLDPGREVVERGGVLVEIHQGGASWP